MGGLVRVKVSHLLISVIVLLGLSLANLGLTVFGSFQTLELVKGQKVIEERVTPLCLSKETLEACRRQIDAAKRSVVVRLCKVVHHRLQLPRVECENALAAVIKRNAAASAHGGSRTTRGPPAPGATGTGPSGVGSIPGGERGPKHPPGKVTPSPAPQPGAGGGPAAEGPVTPHGNQGQGQGSGSVGAQGKGSTSGASVEVEAEVKVPGLEVPPLVPKAVESATGAVEEVGKSVEGVLGQ
jgi:hypothetical protein